MSYSASHVTGFPVLGFSQEAQESVLDLLIVARQVEIMRQQWNVEQPTIVFRIRANVWKLGAFYMNAGKPSLVLESISLTLTATRDSRWLLDRKWRFADFLPSGKSVSVMLLDGLNGTGPVQLPRRTLGDWWRGLPGPSQPSGFLKAVARFSWAGNPYETERQYWVQAGFWGASLTEIIPGETERQTRG